ncbi:MAG: methionine synthase [Chloroflexi bacterium]|nr:methionine synthase [Chloroflexota bacterium]
MTEVGGSRGAQHPGGGVLLTTTVGSFGKPEYLQKARNAFARGKLGKTELEELERKATTEWIRVQEDLDLDILVDGEMYRGDMVAHFAELLDGYTVGGLVRAYGNRYYHKPIISGKVARPKPMTVDWFTFAQSLTDRPVKGMLTGPYTMLDWSYLESYPTRRDAALALAEAIRLEAEDLDRAGAKYIQIDEPAIHARPEELDIAIEAMGIVTQNLKAKTISHICYGDFAAIYPKVLDLPVDQLDLAMVNYEYKYLDLFDRDPFTKEMAIGIVDVHKHALESVEEAAEGIRKGLKYVPADKLLPHPDCGLKTRPVEESIAKCRIVVEATKVVRQELAKASR